MELIKQIDETFKFNDKEIRVLGSYNEPLFVAKDICSILGLSNVTEALKNIPQKWKKIENLTSVSLKSDILYQEQGRNMIILSEPAVYQLIMRSNKPIAQKFKEVVCEDILPSLRKKGEYKIQSIIDKNKELEERQLKIEEENKRLEEEKRLADIRIKQLGNKVLSKQKREHYKDINYIYIVQDEYHKKDRIFVIGKAVILEDRLSSYNKSRDHEVIYCRTCNSVSNMDFIEKCVLYKLDKYREVANRDRFILPDNQDVSLFTKVIDLFVDTFNDDVDPEEELVVDKEEESKVDEEELVVDKEEESKVDEEEIVVDKEEESKVDEVELVVDKEEEIVVDKEEEIVVDKEEEEESETDENEIPKNNIISTSSSNYEVDLLHLEIKRNDPINFEQFIIDFCNLGEDLYEIQSDLRCAYRIWGKCEIDSVQKQFDAYMNQKFKDTRLFLDNQRRHVFLGIKLKPLVYKKTNMNFDFEEFIETKCEINHLYRISYNDFFHFFTEWKKESDPSFEIKRPDKTRIKEILELLLAKGRINHSVNSKTKNLWGVLGIGMKENNFGLIEKKRQNKKLGEFDIETNKLVKEYDSIYCASQLLKIPFSTFGNYIRTQTVVKGKYYKLL